MNDAPRSGYAAYHKRVASCGCRSVPDGIHLPGCAYYSPLPKEQRVPPVVPNGIPDTTEVDRRSHRHVNGDDAGWPD